MQSWQECAIKAFETFVSRGQDVIAHFDDGDVDLALKNLARRNAAIANFRVYDAKCASYSVQQLETLASLSALALHENALIAERLQIQKDEEQKNLRAVVETKKKISRYKSSHEQRILIERSV